MKLPKHSQRGLSLIELMVGLAVGLLVVAAATTVLGGQVQQHRQLGIEQRLMQDLRSAADVITRDLRRAGAWGGAASGIRVAGQTAAANPYAALSSASGVAFSYSRDAMENQQLDANEQFGLRLRAGVVELQLGAGNWQALTDATLSTVTELRITPNSDSVSLAAHCPDCASAPTPCAPRLQVRSVSLAIAARAVADTRVQRNLQSTVRVRNDVVEGLCAP
jgi:type IV pilus assembly protein PilW